MRTLALKRSVKRSVLGVRAYLVARELMLAAAKWGSANSGAWTSVISEIRDRGFAVVRDVFPEEAIRRLSADAAQLAEQFGVETNGDKRMFGAETRSETIRSLFSSNETIETIGREYLGRAPRFQTTMAASMHFASYNLGSGQGWHRDSYARQFKGILYLGDVDETNGPFEYIRGSHKLRNILVDLRELLSKGDGGYNGIRYPDDVIRQLIKRRGYNIDRAFGRAGDLIVADTRGLHRGAPMLGGHRVALTNYYVDF